MNILTKHEYISLVSHVVNVKIASNMILTIAPSGMEARIHPVHLLTDRDSMIPIKVKKTIVTGLPAPKRGVRYIVSSLVFEHLPHRKDLVAPADKVYSKGGQVIGCNFLIGR